MGRSKRCIHCGNPITSAMGCTCLEEEARANEESWEPDEFPYEEDSEIARRMDDMDDYDGQS